MCTTFLKGSDPPYLAWVQANPNGFVFNSGPGTQRHTKVLHRMPCATLNQLARTRNWAANPKTCCARGKHCIVAFMNGKVGAGKWMSCGTCRP
jgi:hypothetical protein